MQSSSARAIRLLLHGSMFLGVMTASMLGSKKNRSSQCLFLRGGIQRENGVDFSVFFRQGKLGVWDLLKLLLGLGLRYNLTKFVKSRFPVIGTQ